MDYDVEYFEFNEEKYDMIPLFFYTIQYSACHPWNANLFYDAGELLCAISLCIWVIYLLSEEFVHCAYIEPRPPSNLFACQVLRARIISMVLYRFILLYYHTLRGLVPQHLKKLVVRYALIHCIGSGVLTVSYG